MHEPQTMPGRQTPVPPHCRSISGAGEDPVAASIDPALALDHGSNADEQ